MPTSKRCASQTIYQLKVTLRYILPPIWRRIQVSGNTGLYKLHRILQVVMGWQDYHLYQFEVGQTHFGDPEPELEMKDARRAKLDSVVGGEKAEFSYEYDFGDSWAHQIVVEEILAREPGRHYPACLAGKRACPPEDCGGTGGYASFLQAIGDPGHEEHDEMLEWIGGSFDPEAFDVDEINRLLARIR